MKFGKLVRNLRSLSKIPSQVATESAEEIEALIDTQFKKGVDPYGKAWARLKNGKRSYLQKTESLRESLEVSARSGSGIRISISGLGRYHQLGTKWMPIRLILPDADLPPKWVQVVADAYNRMLKRNRARV